jgi:hypothetical protein
METITLVYVGAFPSLTIGDTGVVVERNVPAKVPEKVATFLLENRPDEFKRGGE